MSPDLRGRKSGKLAQEAVRQRSVKNGNWFSEGSRLSNISLSLTERTSFDKITLILISGAILISSLYSLSPLGAQEDLFLTTIAAMSAVFTLLTVRESKRDREASAAPTLFIGKRNEGEYGILNLGEGPAHELEVKVATAELDDWKNIKPEIKNKILCIDDFLALKQEGEPKKVRMKYRSNVGYKQYDVTREVLSDNEN